MQMNAHDLLMPRNILQAIMHSLQESLQERD